MIETFQRILDECNSSKPSAETQKMRMDVVREMYADAMAQGGWCVRYIATPVIIPRRLSDRWREL